MAISDIPMRRVFWTTFIVLIAATELIGVFFPKFKLIYWLYLPILIIGIRDMSQTKHAVRRNFPIIGHFRYMLESIRPEINQYFVESDIDGRPFNREKRANVYQRAKKVLNTRPFGTKLNVYEVGYEWMNHSIAPVPKMTEHPRVWVGKANCKQPYLASMFNISAMSYGSLSKNAVMALNKGAKAGGFAHNTGEGGLSPYHLEHGGDLIWQIGTGYFSCRTKEGKFDPGMFAEKSNTPSVKMIEIKLSQGAKPGHGGILPAAKVNKEVAAIRNVEMGQDVISPPWHTAFSTPIELLELVQKMRDLSNGKPVGFKLCVGNKREFLAICKAMIQTGIKPDFITIDGGEGGTGAAPLEFSDSVGMPLEDGLVFVHNALVATNLRGDIRLLCSGKVTTGFNVASKIALGADMCNAARGMLFAVGCIQALQCHANTCPTGVATQNPDLVRGLSVEDKYKRVANFHHETIESFLELISAAGLTHPSQLSPWHIHRRVSVGETKTLAEIYEFLSPGALLSLPSAGGVSAAYTHAWEQANANTFAITPASVSAAIIG